MMKKWYISREKESLSKKSREVKKNFIFQPYKKN